MATRVEIPALTGLRGTAALLVVVTHYSLWCAPYRPGTAPAAFQALFEVDQLGMTLFFTLSGFVITYNYFDMDWRQAPRESLTRFLFLRFSRLYPALMVFFLLILLRQPPRLGDGSITWWTLHLTSVDTWLPFKMFDTLPMNGTFFVSWSISTEIGMYIAFAIFMIFAMRKRMQAVATMVALGAVTIIVLLMFVDSANQFLFSRLAWPLQSLNETEWRTWLFNLSPYGRLLHFALGAVAAYVILRHQGTISAYRPALRWFARIAVAGLIVIYFLPAIGHVFDIRYARHGLITLTIAILFAAVFLNSQDDTTINRLLSNRALVFFGTISYSLYLFHYIRPSLIHLDAAFTWKLAPLLFLQMGLALGFACVLSYGSYLLIEAPSQRRLRVWFDRTASQHKGAHAAASS